MKAYNITNKERIRRSKDMARRWKNGHTKYMLKGSKNGNASLTEGEVTEIKNLLIENELTLGVIAARFNISATVVGNIKRGNNWRHIVSEEDLAKMPILKRPDISEVDAIKIKDLLIKKEKSHKEIGDMFNVAQSTITGIKKGKIKRNIITDEDIERMNEDERPTLTVNEVLSIKSLLKENKLTQAEIAGKFNTHKSTVSRIKTGKIWTSLSTKEELETMNKNESKHKRKLEKEDVIEVLRLIKQGILTYKEIGDRFNVNRAIIYKIAVGKTWRSIVTDTDIEMIKTIRKTNKYNKLSITEINEIENHLLDGQMKQTVIAEMFNVSNATVSNIKHGKY